MRLPTSRGRNPRHATELTRSRLPNQQSPSTSSSSTTDSCPGTFPPNRVATSLGLIVVDLGLLRLPHGDGIKIGLKSVAFLQVFVVVVSRRCPARVVAARVRTGAVRIATRTARRARGPRETGRPVAPIVRVRREPRRPRSPRASERCSSSVSPKPARDRIGEGTLDRGGGVDERVAQRGVRRDQQQCVAGAFTWVGVLLDDRVDDGIGGFPPRRAATAAATRDSRSAVTAAMIACSRLEK